MSGRFGGRRGWMAVAAVGAAAGAAVVAGGTVVRRRMRGAQQPPEGPADVAFMRALHAALRRDLFRLESAVGRLDPSTPAPATVLAGWDEFRGQLDNHHTAEDDDLWPVLRRHLTDPTELMAVDQMVAEHQQIPSALSAVDTALRGGGDPAPPVQHLSSLVRDHLDHEERQVLPLVERELSRAEWQTFLRTERNRRSARERPRFLTWILDDATEQDAAAVLTELPPPARLVYRRVLRPRYNRQHRWQLADQT